MHACMYKYVGVWVSSRKFTLTSPFLKGSFDSCREKWFRDDVLKQKEEQKSNNKKDENYLNKKNIYTYMYIYKSQIYNYNKKYIFISYK